MYEGFPFGGAPVRARVVCFRNADRLQESGRAQLQPRARDLRRHAVRVHVLADAGRHHHLHHRRQRTQLRQGTRDYLLGPGGGREEHHAQGHGLRAAARRKPHHHRRLRHQAAGAGGESGVRTGWRPVPGGAEREHLHRDHRRHDSLHQRRLGPHLHQRHRVRRPHRCGAGRDAQRHRLRHRQARQRRGECELHHPAARGGTGIRSGAGCVHRRAARHADVGDAGRDVQVQH